MESVAIVIADDHPLVRKAVKNAFRNDSRVKFIGEADNGAELLELLKENAPDIAIVDLEMPKMNGYETIQEIHTHYPNVRTIAFSGFLTATNQERAVRMGAFASISKAESPDSFIKAVSEVMKGRTYHSKVSNSFCYDSPADASAPGLTLREKQILGLIAEGKTSRQISEAFNISQWTVDKHRSNIKEKLGLRNLAEMIRFAIEQGYTCRGLQ